MKALAIALAVIFALLAICSIAGVNLGMHALGLDGGHHVKHFVLYVVLAVLAVIWLRFQSAGPAPSTRLR